MTERIQIRISIIFMQYSILERKWTIINDGQSFDQHLLCLLVCPLYAMYRRPCCCCCCRGWHRCCCWAQCWGGREMRLNSMKTYEACSQLCLYTYECVCVCEPLARRQLCYLRQSNNPLRHCRQSSKIQSNTPKRYNVHDTSEHTCMQTKRELIRQIAESGSKFRFISSKEMLSVKCKGTDWTQIKAKAYLWRWGETGCLI